MSRSIKDGVLARIMHHLNMPTWAEWPSSPSSEWMYPIRGLSRPKYPSPLQVYLHTPRNASFWRISFRFWRVSFLASQKMSRMMSVWLWSWWGESEWKKYASEVARFTRSWVKYTRKFMRQRGKVIRQISWWPFEIIMTLYNGNSATAWWSII